MQTPNPPNPAAPPPRPSWPLGQAKARFSEVVRLARSGRPQRVTVHAREAVTVVATPEFERLSATASFPTLHELLSNSPLGRGGRRDQRDARRAAPVPQSPRGEGR